MDAGLQFLFQCPHPGCNRKYKVNARLALHLRDTHGLNDEQAEIKALAATQYLSKPPRNGAGGATPKPPKSKPILIAVVPAPGGEEEEEERGLTVASECCICYDAPAGGAAAVPCGHAAFCYPCLMGCFGKRQPCPQCRGDMSAVIKLFQ